MIYSCLPVNGDTCLTGSLYIYVARRQQLSLRDDAHCLPSLATICHDDDDKLTQIHGKRSLSSCTIRWSILKCAKKLTNSRLNLPHGTKQEKSNEETKNKKPVSIHKAGRVHSICLLWSPYVIGQTIIFLPCDFYLSSFFFFLA